MIDCINNAEITSNTYGAIFYGYHPLYYKDDNGNAVEFLFDGCVNNADVSMGYASMFFGNPTGMEEAVANNEFDLTITNCDNNKNINGINSSHYLVPSINSTTLTTELAGLESEIQSNSSNKLDPQKLTTGGTLEGFTYSIDSDKKIDVTAPTDDENVSYYVVSVGSYFHLYSNDANAPRPYNGTEQYVVTETIMAENLNAGVSLKYYGIADANYGSAGTGIFCQISPDYEYETYATRTNNDQTYYELPLLRNGALIDGFYRCYAQVNPTTKEPVTGYANPAFINVTAYDDNGNVLGFAKEVDPA